jgi:putative addiction module component (TIGR02574 family)
MITVASRQSPNLRGPNLILALISMALSPVTALLKLPKRRRLEIAESLWLSVADEKKMPVPAAHKRVLDARLKDYRSGKSKPITHDELMLRLRAL